MPGDPWFGLIDASLEAARRTLQAFGQATAEPASTRPVWRWTTRNRIVADYSTMQVREFHRGRVPAGPAVIVVAPYALHTATTADFARGHSLVAALLRAGIRRIVLTHWRSAGTGQSQHTIDTHLAELNALVDDVGAPAPLVGLCQGGLLAAIYAARFPRKVSRLVLAGAPLDVDAAASSVSNMIRRTPPEAVDALIARGDGVLRSDFVMSLWPTATSAESDIRAVLQGDDPSPALVRRYGQWNADVVDLPGAFYRETVDRIFRRNAFARGEFPALGRHVGLRDVHCPLFLLAAAQDDVVHPAQVLAARGKVSTPARDITSCLVEGRHLSLYMGHDVLAEAWPRAAAFLKAGRAEGHRHPAHRAVAARRPAMRPGKKPLAASADQARTP